MKSIYNEYRLRIIDRLLQKGWCSYLDMAKAINDAIQENDTRYGIGKHRGGATEVSIRGSTCV